MDSFYLAWSFFRRRNYDKCIDLCTILLEKNPYDEAAWLLKMQALTSRVYIDDLETENIENIEDDLDETIIAAAPRPGTSLKTADRSSLISSGRPMSSSGRPLSGITRPGTQSRPNTTLKRPMTTRPFTSQAARTIRLGTAAILSQADGPFIQVSRLNFAKYAGKSNVAKSLFEYIYYHEGDIKSAMELAVQAIKNQTQNDWWWKLQLAKCYIAQSLLRNGEQLLQESLSEHPHIETFIRLTRIYIKLDQPLMAIQSCKAGLEKFPNDITIMTELARINEMLNEIDTSTNWYREIVVQDAMNIEAIACIGLHHFYTEQPELALRYYRRVLQMGVSSAELYNNLGLCCLYSQQYDLILPCFQRALNLALEPEIKAEIWYNLSHVAMNSGDLDLTENCLRLCLSNDSTHASALNNLAVLENKKGRKTIAKAYFITAKNLAPSIIEIQKNLQFLSDLN